MKRLLTAMLLGGAALALAHCSGNSDTAQASGNDPANKAVAATDSSSVHPAAAAQTVYPVPDSGLFAFYVMNDKTAGSPDSLRECRWIGAFLDSVQRKGINPASSIFSLNGSGPLGSQLNPNADLFVLAFFDGRADTASIRHYVNDYGVHSRIRGTANTAGGKTMTWFVIPRINANRLRHLPSAEEKKTIAAAAHLDEKGWDANSCTVLKIGAEGRPGGKACKYEKYVLMSYGN